MILYIANRNSSSWSLRPWILMRVLGLAFEERVIPFAEGSSYARFREFSPTGRLPCLRNGAELVWDSMAIIEYLAERRAEVWPEEPSARAWARCASAEMHAGFAALRRTCPMDCRSRTLVGSIGSDLSRDLARLDELWTEGLRMHGGPFLAGDRFTAVDAFFAPVAFRFRTYGLQAGPQALAYVSRLLDLPAMQEWDSAASDDL